MGISIFLPWLKFLTILAFGASWATPFVIMGIYVTWFFYVIAFIVFAVSVVIHSMAILKTSDLDMLVKKNKMIPPLSQKRKATIQSQSHRREETSGNTKYVERKYTFFNGYSKFKFSRNLSPVLFQGILYLTIIVLWIFLFDFITSLIAGTMIAITLTLFSAIINTKKIFTYTINGKEYLLYDELLYCQNHLKLKPESIFTYLDIRFKRYKNAPKKIAFIDEFLIDFIKCSKAKCPEVNLYFEVFKKIDLEDIDISYVNGENKYFERIKKYKDEEIVELFDILRFMNKDEDKSSETYLKGLNLFKEMLDKNKQCYEDITVEVFGHMKNVFKK